MLGLEGAAPEAADYKRFQRGAVIGWLNFEVINGYDCWAQAAARCGGSVIEVMLGVS
jgi:hypothetical protein